MPTGVRFLKHNTRLEKNVLNSHPETAQKNSDYVEKCSQHLMSFVDPAFRRSSGPPCWVSDCDIRALQVGGLWDHGVRVCVCVEVMAGVWGYGVCMCAGGVCGIVVFVHVCAEGGRG